MDDDMGHHSGSHDMSMTGSTVLDAVLLLLLLAATAFSAATLLRGQHAPTTHASGPRAEVAHVVMNLAMVWMLTPWWSTVAAWIVLAASVLTGAGFLTLLVLRDRTVEQRAASAYHLFAAAGLAGTALAMAPGTGHGTEAGGLAPLWWVLAALFALDLLGTAAVAVAPPASVIATTPSTAGSTSIATRPRRTAHDQVRHLRIAAFPHACMDVGMVAMLIALT